MLHVLPNVYVSLLSYSHSQPAELLFSPTALHWVHTRWGLCLVHFDSMFWAVGVQDRVLHVLESLPWWPCGELEGARLQLRRQAESYCGHPCLSWRSLGEQKCEVHGAVICILFIGVSQMPGIQFNICLMSECMDRWRHLRNYPILLIKDCFGIKVSSFILEWGWVGLILETSDLTRRSAWRNRSFARYWGIRSGGGRKGSFQCMGIVQIWQGPWYRFWPLECKMRILNAAGGGKSGYAIKAKEEVSSAQRS